MRACHSMPHRDLTPNTLRLLSEVVRLKGNLLEELLGIIHRQQRAAVADDLATVEDGIFSTYRILRTLEEAQRKYRSINRLLGFSDDVSVGDLEAILGEEIPAELRQPLARLRTLADTLVAEIETTRRVVRRTLGPGATTVEVSHPASV
jgi:hypothetical protein